jgi:hypothetical protein
VFKFIWIIMIIFVVGIFVAYTIDCCIQTAKYALSLKDWSDTMWLEHEYISLVWTIIFIIASVLIFVSSFVEFILSFE